MTRHPLPLALAIVAAVAIVFAPVARHGFVNFDDPQYVSENPFISDGLTLRGIAWAFTTGYAGNWHPLTWISHMLDVQVFGLSAGAHHVMNVVLHTASALLLFLLLYRITSAIGRSWFVAALFAVHPLHVESVAWIAERKDVLSALFWMLTIWAYVRYVHRPAVAPYSLVGVLFALGLMAKPMLVTLPVTLLLLDVWPLRRTNTRRLIREKVPLFTLAIASSVVTFMVQQQAGAVKELASLPVSRRVANALVAYVSYTGKTLWPTNLAAIYPYPDSIAGWQVAAAIAALAIVTWLAVRVRRDHPYVLIGWLWYLVTLIPVIGLIQVGSQPIADRYTYVPLIGLFIIVAWGVPEILARRRVTTTVLATAAVVVVAACVVAARAQVDHWRSSVALWQHAVSVTTDNYRAQGNLGHALAAEGRRDEAIQHYSEAVRIRPSYAEAHNNLGLALARQGRIEEAIPHYAEALRLLPDYFEAHSNLGAALAGTGRYTDAINHFSIAARLQPEHPQAQENLVRAHYEFGRALAERGDIDQAIQQFLEALRLDPTNADVHYDLGVMFVRKGDLRAAINRFEEALRIDANHQDARRALDVLSRR
ncbi:MAG TPA: tetratricopeptide repeat protein [Vicinamibacterales bacterium]|nr:tetratricopeptide repeat protein [Vicinamibacterales bacterium]